MVLWSIRMVRLTISNPASLEFNALKRELGVMVMEEQQRHHADEVRLAAVD